jgi:hypothetical protein
MATDDISRGVGTPISGPERMKETVRHEPHLLEQVRVRLRLKHYSYRTEKSYLAWIRRYIVATGRRHPRI